MIKEVYKGIAYYYELPEHLASARAENLGRHNLSTTPMLRNATVVVDTERNQLLKMRLTLEDTFDKVFNV
jgi:hypothetical protein